MADSPKDEPVWRSRTPQRATLRQREAQRLREVEGLTFQEIAERLGYAHKGSAKKAYEKAVADGELMRLTDSEWRDLQLRRLERLYSIAAKHADTSDDPLAAVEKAGRIHDRIVRLRGLEVIQVAAPPGGSSLADEDGEDAGTLVSEKRFRELRERRERDAAQRAAGR